VCAGAKEEAAAAGDAAVRLDWIQLHIIVLRLANDSHFSTYARMQTRRRDEVI